MTNRIKIIAVVLLVWMSGTSAQAAAWWGGKEKKRDPGRQIVQRLNLSADQQRQFTAAREKVMKETKPLMDKIKDRSEQLKSELEKEKPDRRTIEQSIRDINGWRTEIEIKRVNSLLELKAGLTPDQRQKFRELMGRPRGFGFGGGRK